MTAAPVERHGFSDVQRAPQSSSGPARKCTRGSKPFRKAAGGLHSDGPPAAGKILRSVRRRPAAVHHLRLYGPRLTNSFAHRPASPRHRPRHHEHPYRVTRKTVLEPGRLSFSNDPASTSPTNSASAARRQWAITTVSPAQLLTPGVQLFPGETTSRGDFGG